MTFKKLMGCQGKTQVCSYFLKVAIFGPHFLQLCCFSRSSIKNFNSGSFKKPFYWTRGDLATWIYLPGGFFFEYAAKISVDAQICVTPFLLGGTHTEKKSVKKKFLILALATQYIHLHCLGLDRVKWKLLSTVNCNPFIKSVHLLDL